MTPINIISYNIHKGMSPLNRTVILHDLVKALANVSIDVLFLQEVQGQNLKRANCFENYPDRPQHEWLGECLSLSSIYGANADYVYGHHGNAMLCRYPFDVCQNVNMTVNRLEKRGMLHGEIYPPNWGVPVSVLNVHLNLFEKDRIKQYHTMMDYISNEIDEDKPLILAGDFNDWTKKSEQFLAKLGLVEIFKITQNKYPATFPAKYPILSLDRIYVRHLKVLSTHVYRSEIWAKLSDHLPIGAKVVLDK